MRVVINWFSNATRGNFQEQLVCVETLFLPVIFSPSQVFALPLFLSCPITLEIRRLPAPNLSFTGSIFLSSHLSLGPSFFFPPCIIYSIFAPLSFFASLIRFSLHYGVISVPVIQSEGQQKSLGAWNRLLSQAESTDTFSAGITLFHYRQSSFSLFFCL